MSLQTIIDRAESISIDHRRTVATTMSRNQKIVTATRSTTQPWQFKVTPTNAYRWDQNGNRGVIASIESIDRHTATVINLANNPGMHWITAYQGGLEAAQLGDLTISSASGTTMVLNLGTTVQSLPSTTVLFAAGDIIQPSNSNYPYKVMSTVTRGTGTSRTLTLHRPIIPEAGVTLPGASLDVGINCTWTVKIVGLPTYTIAPGRFIEWGGDFELVEVVA